MTAVNIAVSEYGARGPLGTAGPEPVERGEQLVGRMRRAEDVARGPPRGLLTGDLAQHAPCHISATRWICAASSRSPMTKAGSAPAGSAPLSSTIAAAVASTPPPGGYGRRRGRQAGRRSIRAGIACRAMLPTTGSARTLGTLALGSWKPRSFELTPAASDRPFSKTRAPMR